MNLVEGFGFPATVTAGTLDGTANPYAMGIKQDVKDQYMMGDYLLVAPMFEGEKTRKVYLPAGKWYDFYTGELAGENQVIEVTPGLEKIPLFVKDGGIIPMVPPHRNALEAERKLPLEVRHYGTAEGSFSLYDDDGKSFNYDRGEYSYTKLKVTKDAQGKLRGTMAAVQAGKPFSYASQVQWRFMTPEAK